MPSYATEPGQRSGVARDEADRIYRAIFGAPIPEVLHDRFAEPSAGLDRLVSSTERQRYRRVIEEVGDLEAAEVAARYTGGPRLLCRKFELMVYLAETLPANQHHFVNTRDNFLAGVIIIMYGAMRTGFKLCKGALLLRSISRA